MNNGTIISEDQVGCWLGSPRGHYLSRDVIDLATGFGFIIGPFEQYAVSMYDNAAEEGGCGSDEYPHEGIIELCDEAVAWLNTGQGECPACDAKGYWSDNIHMICKVCSGSGRGPDRIAGQNFPPRVPEGYVWEFNDGDFGLYQYDEDGNPVEPS
jgi:hypothetical protein